MSIFTRISLVSIPLLMVANLSAAADPNLPGFVAGSHLDVLLRNAYISRDYKHQKTDKAEWGQAAIATFSSGYTPGLIGVGVDAFGVSALRLDGGRGKSGAAGIDFFEQDDSGHAARDLFRGGAAIKFRFSATELVIGDQMPMLPVLTHDYGRLLPESYNGAMITSKEIYRLVVHAGRFTAQQRKSAEGRDSGGLKSINVIGASYQATDRFSAQLYASEVQAVLSRQYVGAKYVLPVAANDSLTFYLQGYRTEFRPSYVTAHSLTGRDNKIWSLSSTYKTGPHSFTVAYQRSTGDNNLGYSFGGYQKGQGRLGDGGNTIYLANAFWSDFNAEDERSWQVGYGLNFDSLGVPGLTYNVAFIQGSNISTRDSSGGSEREVFNQLQYVIQSGFAKNFTVKVRSSALHVSKQSSAYNVSGNEVRIFLEYPIRIF